MDLGKIANSPLLGNAFAPRKKEWLPVVLAAAGLATSLVGGAKASSAAREAERKQRAQEAKENAWYTRRYNEDYVDTAAGQNLVRRAKEYAKESWKKAAGAQAVAGGTDSATQMAKDAGNKMVGDTLANIAAHDTQRKDNVDNLHRQAESQFAQMDMNREMQRAQNISNAASQAGNSLMSMAGALSQTNMAKADLNGGSNNSVEFNPPTVEKATETIKSPMDVYNQTEVGSKEWEHFRNHI